MARTYHIDVVAFACEADNKWVDNVLSRFEVPGVEGGQRGAARRIAITGIHQLALARSLLLELGLPVAAAVSFSARLLASASGSITLDQTLSLAFDRTAFLARVDRRVAEAAEVLVPARRGRPPLRSRVER